MRAGSFAAGIVLIIIAFVIWNYTNSLEGVITIALSGGTNTYIFMRLISLATGFVGFVLIINGCRKSGVEKLQEEKLKKELGSEKESSRSSAIVEGYEESVNPREQKKEKPERADDDTALSILDKRYAAGKISKKEYLEKKHHILGTKKR